jgi:ubiquinone/menaquinone biosynthesis C-methylase UbiE
LKFTSNENKEFWNEYAKKSRDNPFGAHTDNHVVQLENNFIFHELEQKKPQSLLDIGCGNGQRTIQFTKYIENSVKGIDYSDEMISEAQKLLLQQDDKIKQKLKFEIKDVTKFQSNQFDAITSCRCFINQPSEEEQIKLFETLHDKLKDEGSLIIAEESIEGIQRLNKIRTKFGLGEIDIRWHNLPIKEKSVFDAISHLFDIKTIQRLGTFYYISRVINPALAFPEEPQPNSKINEIGFKTELEFQNLFENNNFEDFGVQLLIHFKKK